MDEDRIEGAATTIGGKIKDAAGGLVGDAGIQARGKADQLSGRAQNAYGSAKDAVGEGAWTLADQVEEFVHDQPIVAGQKPLDFYSRLVFQAGNDTANAAADSEASALIVRQLGDQRASISGVSLDEEASNIIKYQAAYQAAARVVTTVNTLLGLAVNLGQD